MFSNRIVNHADLDPMHEVNKNVFLPFRVTDVGVKERKYDIVDMQGKEILLVSDVGNRVRINKRTQTLETLIQISVKLNAKYDELMPVVDTCDFGHKFLKLSDHPSNSSGRPRCVYCLASAIDTRNYDFTTQSLSTKDVCSLNISLNRYTYPSRNDLDDKIIDILYNASVSGVPRCVIGEIANITKSDIDAVKESLRHLVDCDLIRRASVTGYEWNRGVPRPAILPPSETEQTKE